MSDSFQLGCDDFSVHDLRESIRDNPDNLVGASTERSTSHLVYDLETKKLVNKTISVSPANIKLYKEIFSNATDNSVTTIMHTNLDPSGSKKKNNWSIPEVGAIDINITEYTISITSRGNPIPIGPCKESDEDSLILPPFRVFGTTYSGTNSDKSRLGLGAGKNGIGAKATNILSTSFTVEAGNNRDGQLFRATWINNMLEVADQDCEPGFAWDDEDEEWVSLATESNGYAGENFVTVTYTPDIVRYGWTKYDLDKVSLFAQIANSGAFASRITVNFTYKVGDMKKAKTVVFAYNKTSEYLKLLGVKGSHSIEKVFWNKTANQGQIQFKDTKDITKIPIAEQMKIAYHPMCMEDFPFAEVYLYDTPNSGGFVAFVNGNETPQGGIHCDAVISPIVTFVKKALGREKDRHLDASVIFKHVTLVCLFRINQPFYGDQAKSKLDYYKEPQYRGGKLVVDAMGKPDLLQKTKIKLDNYDPKFFKEWKAFEEIQKQYDTQTVAKPAPLVKHLEVDKHDGANLSGTDRGFLCTLFVPEGDAAKDYPSAMINMLPGGRDVYGILPLRGKLPNVCKMTHKKFIASKLLSNLVRVVGLTEGVDYTTEAGIKTLRYGYICCMKDADVDGNHINCLMINLLHEKFPTFLLAGRYSYFDTPIIRVEQIIKESMIGLPKVKIIDRFYNEADFEVWRKSQSNKRNCRVRYLKGLGSSNANDRKDDAIHGKMIVVTADARTSDVMHTAFGKKMADERKKWMLHFSTRPCTASIELFSESTVHNPPISYEVSKTRKSNKNKYNGQIDTPQPVDNEYYRMADNIVNCDLIDYSLSSLERAIPSIRDGLKKSLRQAMWCILEKWNYGNNSSKSTMKVARLASEITGKVNYKHGDTSMQMVIIKQCQEFTGGNNLAVYLPDGSFGSRRYGGTDAGPSKSRYTSTSTQKWHSLLMDKKMTDNVPRVKEEDEDVEPYFIPMLIPLVLVNGIKGLATAYCSSIPPHNIFDIINWYIIRCDDKYGEMPLPWYKGFIGTNIIKDAIYGVSTSLSYVEASDLGASELENDGEEEENIPEDLPDTDFLEETEEGRKLLDNFLCKHTGQRIESYGIYERLNNADGTTDVHITEFPIGVCQDTYKKNINMWIDKKWIADFIDGGSSIDNRVKKDKFFVQKRGKKSTKKSEEEEEEEDDGSKVNILLFNVDTEHIEISHIGLKLKKVISMANMNLLNKNSYPVHFDNVSTIMNAHYTIILREIETLRLSIIEDKKADLDLINYKLILIGLIDAGTVGTKSDEDKWKKEMSKAGIPQTYFSSLLGIPVRVLMKNDTETLKDKARKISKEIEKYRKLTNKDMYKDKLIALRDGLDGLYPKNTNPTEIGNIAVKEGKLIR